MRWRRPAYAALGFVAIFLAILVVFRGHQSWWPLAVFVIAPDITLLVGGFGTGLRRGQLNPRSVPFYNAVHRFWAPAVLTLVALAAGLGPWVAAGLAWIAHIAFDRSLGFGLRAPDGFQRRTT